MGALVMVESCILALTTGMAVAQSPSAPIWVRSGGVYACPSAPDMQATWLIAEATPGRVQPSAFTRMGLRPFGYMENRRWDDEGGEGMWNNEELRERYRNYGYDYPPSAYAYPRFGPYYHDPDTGRYYNFSRGYYYNPSTGRHQYVYPGPGYYGPNNGW